MGALGRVASDVKKGGFCTNINVTALAEKGSDSDWLMQDAEERGRRGRLEENDGFATVKTREEKAFESLPRWQQRRILRQGLDTSLARDLDPNEDIQPEFQTRTIRQLVDRYEPAQRSRSHEDDDGVPEESYTPLHGQGQTNIPLSHRNRTRRRSSGRNTTGTQQRGEKERSSNAEAGGWAAAAAGAAVNSQYPITEESDRTFVERIARAYEKKLGAESMAVMRGDADDEHASGNVSSSARRERLARFQEWEQRTPNHLRQQRRHHRHHAPHRRLGQEEVSRSARDVDHEGIHEPKDGRTQTAANISASGHLQEEPNPKLEPKPKPSTREYGMGQQDGAGDSEDSDFLDALSKINKRSLAKATRILRKDKQERERRKVERKLRAVGLRDGQRVTSQDVIEHFKAPSDDELKERIEQMVAEEIRIARLERRLRATELAHNASNHLDHAHNKK